MRKLLFSISIVSFFFGLASAIFLIPFWWHPVIQAVSDGKPSDWIGFAGSMAGAIVAIMAAAIAWDAIQKQIEAQQKIANRQLAIQSFDVLIKQTELLERDYANAKQWESFANLLAINLRKKLENTFRREELPDVQRTLKEYFEKAAEIQKILKEGEAYRWVSPDNFDVRSEIDANLIQLGKRLFIESRDTKDISDVRSGKSKGPRNSTCSEYFAR